MSRGANARRWGGDFFNEGRTSEDRSPKLAPAGSGASFVEAQEGGA